MDSTSGMVGQDSVHTLEGLLMKMAWVEYKRFWRELSTHQLTPSQFHTLIAVKENNTGCTMRQLAELTNQVSPTMTGIIDRLVERGWVERSANPADRRTVLVHLTDQGRRKLDAVYHAQYSQLAGCLKELDETSRHNFVFSLEKYLKILETAAADPQDG